MVDPEPYIDAAIAALRDDATGVNHFIGLANAAHSDFDIDTVEDEDVHAGGGTMLLRWPAIEVAAPDWDVGNISLAQMSADLTLRTIVMCWYQDASGFDPLYRASMRFADAALRCLMQPDAWAPADARVTVSAVSGRYRVNPETNERAEFTAGTLLVFSLDVGVDR